MRAGPGGSGGPGGGFRGFPIGGGPNRKVSKKLDEAAGALVGFPIGTANRNGPERLIRRS